MWLTLKLALRYALGQPARTLVTALGVAAGVAGLRAIELGTQGALDSVKTAYEQAAGQASLVVVPAGDTLAPLPGGVFPKLAAMEGVEAALPLLQQQTVRMEELSGWVAPLYPGELSGVLLLGVDFAREERRGRFRAARVAVEGPAPALAGVSWAVDRKLEPGSEVRLLAGKEDLKLVLTGLVEREGLGAKNYGQVILLPIETLRRAYGLPADAVGEVALVVADSRMEEVAGRIRRELGPGVTVLRPAERGKDVALRMNNIRAGTDLTSSLALFICAFLVFGLYATAAAERRRETGVLRCVGATRAQAAWPLVAEALVCALPGAVLGAALGSVLASGVAATFSKVAAAEVRAPPADLAGAIRVGLIGFAVALASAAWPAIQASRQPPFEAVRSRSSAAEGPAAWTVVAALAAIAAAVGLLVWEPPRSSGTVRTYVLGLLLIAGCTALLPGIINRVASALTGPAARWLGGGAALGVAGPRWRPVRSGLAAGAVLSAVGMVGALAAVGLGVREQMGDWADRALGWDFFVRRPVGIDSSDVEAARRTPGVLRVSPVVIRPAEVVTQDGRRLSLSVMGLSPAAYADDDAFTFAGGSQRGGPERVRALEDGAHALVTSVLAEQLAVRAGEKLVLQTPAGERPLEVTAEVVDYTQNGFAVMVDLGVLERDFAVARADLMTVRMAKGADAKQVAAALAALPGVKLETRGQLKVRVLGMVDEALAAMDGLLLLAAVVGLLAVSSSVALSAIERRSDIAALRSLGMSRRQVGAMICAEATVTAVVGALGGITVGMFLGWVFAESTHRVGFPVNYVVPWRALALAALSVILAALPAAWLPARRAARISPAEALRES